MKVLIITYYWPPAGGSGVQRWLKFVKYLQDFGIEPIVYTVDQPNYPIIDSSLASEIPEGITVLKQAIWEPNTLLSIFKKKRPTESAGFLNPNPSFFGKMLQYIRANYFIPDARKFWIKPSVKFLKDYLSKNTVDAIITSGPPHSLHLIGLALKREFQLKWISDFRDPWTAIDYFHQLPLTKKSIQKHQLYERAVLKNSDTVLVVGNAMKKQFKAYSNTIHVLTNGFDTELTNSKNTLDTKFSLTHIGLMNADRNPNTLWKVLAEICNENTDFQRDLEIKIIGKVAVVVTEDLRVFEENNINMIGYVSHQAVIDFQCQAQVLLLLVNRVPNAKGIITGKIFEYLQANRPILAIGPPDGDLAEIITATSSGTIVDFDDAAKLKSTILSLYRKFKGGNLKGETKNIEQFHRRTLTKKLAEIIRETTSN